MAADVKSCVPDVPRVSLIVPTLNPGPQRLRALITALRAQRDVALELIVADSSSDDGSEALDDLADVHLRVPRAEFDHGGTRNLAARKATGDVLVFMTQDATPVGDGTLARLIAPVVRGEAAAAYARQVAPPDLPLLERIARELNYPPASAVRSLEDVPALGIRAFLLSNVASAVDRAAFARAGGFPERTIFNEDLFLAAALLADGGRIAYVADAVVEHGHAYGLGALLRRYFDNGASMRHAPEALRSAPTGGAGIRFARAQASALVGGRRPDLLPRWAVETLARWLGYQLGRRYMMLPPAWRRRLSLQPSSSFWEPPT